MVHIVADVVSLVQYLSTLRNEPERYRLKYCLRCGKAGVWFHGCYPRKADRCSGPVEGSLNPIWIQRFYCPECRRTCSVLPECIPPRRWYLWEMQQVALLLILSGKSFYAVAKEIMPSRYTLARWIARFKEQFNLHKDALCGHFVELGRTVDFTAFWQTCLKQMSLSCAMRLCHVAGVSVS